MLNKWVWINPKAVILRNTMIWANCAQKSQLQIHYLVQGNHLKMTLVHLKCYAFLLEKWVNWILTPPPYFTARFLSSSFYVFQWIRQQCSNRRKDVHHTNAVNYTDHLHDGSEPCQHSPSWRRSLRRKQWKSSTGMDSFQFFSMGRWQGYTNDILSVCECSLSSYYFNQSLNLLHLETLPTLYHCSRTSNEPPSETFTT